MSKVQFNQDGRFSWLGLTKIFTTAATLATLFLPKVVYAGNGTFDKGVHNFCVIS